MLSRSGGNSVDDNLKWLGIAFGAGWLILFAYLHSIGRQAQHLKTKVVELERLFGEKE